MSFTQPSVLFPFIYLVSNLTTTMILLIVVPCFMESSSWTHWGMITIYKTQSYTYSSKLSVKLHLQYLSLAPQFHGPHFGGQMVHGGTMDPIQYIGETRKEVDFLLPVWLGRVYPKDPPSLFNCINFTNLTWDCMLVVLCTQSIL